MNGFEGITGAGGVGAPEYGGGCNSSSEGIGVNGFEGTTGAGGVGLTG